MAWDVRSRGALAAPSVHKAPRFTGGSAAVRFADAFLQGDQGLENA